MSEPIRANAVLVIENLLLGNQLVNKLQDMGYIVHSFAGETDLLDFVKKTKPLLMVIELNLKKYDALNCIKLIKSDSSTAHVPILAVFSGKKSKIIDQAKEAGATMIASSAALIDQLNQIINQLLEIE
jgi:PleD family two-component response regulator